LNDLFNQYQNYILLGIAFVILAILSKLESVRNAIGAIWLQGKAAVTFMTDALTESNGKTSYSRLAGTYVILKIMAESKGTDIPEQWMTLFMFLIGYQLISGVLRDNPAIFELLKAKYSIAPTEKRTEEPAQ